MTPEVDLWFTHTHMHTCIPPHTNTHKGIDTHVDTRKEKSNMELVELKVSAYT